MPAGVVLTWAAGASYSTSDTAHLPRHVLALLHLLVPLARPAHDGQRLHHPRSAVAGWVLMVEGTL